MAELKGCEILRLLEVEIEHARMMSEYANVQFTYGNDQRDRTRPQYDSEPGVSWQMAMADWDDFNFEMTREPLTCSWFSDESARSDFWPAADEQINLGATIHAIKLDADFQGAHVDVSFKPLNLINGHPHPETTVRLRAEKSGLNWTFRDSEKGDGHIGVR